jgi:hypothetical protein
MTSVRGISLDIVRRQGAGIARESSDSHMLRREPARRLPGGFFFVSQCIAAAAVRLPAIKINSFSLPARDPT